MKRKETGEKEGEQKENQQEQSKRKQQSKQQMKQQQEEEQKETLIEGCVGVVGDLAVGSAALLSMPAISGCEKRCWKNQRKCSVTWQDAFSSSPSSLLRPSCSVVKTNAKSAASNWLQKVKKKQLAKGRGEEGKRGEEGGGGISVPPCATRVNVQVSSKRFALLLLLQRFRFLSFLCSALRITFAVSGSHAATPPPMRQPKTTKALLEQ